MGMLVSACSFFLVAWLFRLHGAGVRQSLLRAAVSWGVFVVVITEALSFFHALTYVGLLSSWIATALMLVAWVLQRIRLQGHARLHDGEFARVPVPPVPPPAESQPSEPPVGAPAALIPFESKKSQETAKLRLPGIDRGLIVAIIAIAAVTGIAGVASAPANADSMNYHLPRVMHWIYNRSVAHYPAGFLPQLYHAPWAEFAILHFQLLSGGDRFAFAVQWLAMVGSLLAVSLIARRLGAGRRGQILAAVFAATLPAGIVQAESTQNNYIPAFWILCFIAAILDLRNDRGSRPLKHAMLAGCALGLAMLTKGTAYLFVLPFVAWFAIVAIRTKRPIAVLSIAGVLALSLNLPHWLRNYRLFGTPLIPAAEASWYRVEGFSLNLWASNIFSHVTLQLCPPGNRAARTFYTGYTWMCHHLGLDPGDPRIMVRPHSFAVFPFDMHEDCASNPVHLLLIAMTAGILLHARRFRNLRRDTAIPAVLEAPCGEPSEMQSASPASHLSHGRDARVTTASRCAIRPGVFLALVAIAFLAFCAGIKWTRFNGRLELTLFVLAAAPVGAALERLKPRLLATSVAVGLLVLSVPILLLNPTHPLIRRDSIFKHSREQQYFAMHGPLGRSSIQAADLIARRAPHGPVGLAAREKWEYTWWVLLESRAGELREIVPLPAAVVPQGWTPRDPGKMSAIIVMDGELLPQLTSGPCAGWNRADFERCTVLWPVRERGPRSGS
jgi:4-amino-4-deoxy-L-arabinose transferase-like glycosyltransferase